MRTNARRAVLAISAVSMVFLGQLALGQSRPATKPGSPPSPAKPPMPTSVALLKIADMNFRDALAIEPNPGSMWRYFDAWQTDVCRTDSGELIRVDPLDAVQVQNKDGAWVDLPLQTPPGARRVKPTTTMRGSPLPPEGWQQPTFDDRSWLLCPGRARSTYRATALMCLRGRFEVNDPAGVKKLTLNLEYHGGVVVYLNGKEIARASLPAGKLAPDTLAEPYPKDVYVGPDGGPINVFDWWGGYLERKGYRSSPAIGPRNRALAVEVPAAALQKGVNVLAVEVHRAPADEVMFAVAKPKNGGEFSYQQRIQFCWNRCQLDSLRLSAEMDAGAATPNCTQPAGTYLREYPAFVTLDPNQYADAYQGPPELRVSALRNGAFHAQLVLTSDKPIRKLSAAVSDLAAEKGKLPIAAVSVGYPKLVAFAGDDYNSRGAHFEGIEPTPPAEVPPVAAGERSKVPVAMQPIWITVNVPREAAKGLYRGKVTVSSEGFGPVDVPLEVNIPSEWVLPDPPKFKPYVALMESPDTLAAQYNVPLWSEDHWKLIEKSFALMGQLGCKEIHVPLVAETHLGNAQSMVIWDKPPSPQPTTQISTPSAYKPDLTNAERYIGLAGKYLGPDVNVCCTIIAGQYSPVGYSENPVRLHPRWVTVRDPKTRELSKQETPDWSTPEAAEFWKPVFDGLRQAMTKHGVKTELAFDYFQMDCGNWKDCTAMLKQLVPNFRMVGRSHNGGDMQGPNRIYMSIVGGSGVFWDVDRDEPCYNWRSKWQLLSFARDGYPCKDFSWGSMRNVNPPAGFFNFPERTMLTGTGRTRGSVPWQGGTRGGFGHWGLDYWQVPIDGDAKPKCLINRYLQCTGATVTSLACPGSAGPVASQRGQMVRAGLQDFEARAFIQDALLDNPDKLGPDLAKRCKTLCDDRTRFQAYCGNFYTETESSVGVYRQMADDLYKMTDEVAKAMAK